MIKSSVSSAKAIRQLVHSGRSRSSNEEEDDDSDSDDDETFWYICTTCNQAFQEERKVKKHRKRIHSSKSGQIIFLTDKQLHPQILLKRSSLEDNVVNGDDGLAQVKENHQQCEVSEVRKSRSSKVGQEFHSEESDQLALENSSITRLLKRKRRNRQSQADTDTNGAVTDTQPELVRLSSVEVDCVPRAGSNGTPETNSPRLELSKKITSSNNSHLMIITQNELLPQVKLVRCERTGIHPAPAGPAGGSVMVEISRRIDLLKDNSDQEPKLKKKKRDRRKKNQQELRSGEDEASLSKQAFPSETNSNAYLKKVEGCVSPVRKVPNVEIPDLKIEGYTLAEELNSLEFAEHIPDNNDDWFNSSDSPSPSPQPELVPLSRDTAESSVSAANVQQESESLNLDYRRLKLEEHKHFEQEMIVADDEVENVEEEQADDARTARSLRPRKDAQGKHGSDKIDDPDSENNDKSDDEDEDDEMDHADDDCFYEDSSSDPESTSSLTIKKKKPKEEPTDHTCKLCGNIYQLARPFVIHMKTVHQQHVTTNEKRFPCTLCEKDYRYKRDLKRHLRNHEWFASGQGSCTICQRSFGTKEGLSYHMGASHANGAGPTSGTSPKNKKAKEVKVKKKKPKEEPTDHTCKICGQIYRLIGPFVTHMKTVHQQQVQVATNEKRFPCTVCEKDLATNCYHPLLTPISP